MCSLEEDCFLRRGSDAHIEGNFASVNPVVDENVRWTRESARNETWQFLLRVERGTLSHGEDGIPNSVMAASFHPVVVAAVESVISKVILKVGAGECATFSGSEKRDAKSVAHGSSKRAGVEVEVEHGRGKSVKPVPSVGESERVKTRHVPSRGGGEEKGPLMRVDFRGK